MKCGEDDDGYSVKTKLKHFLKYLENNQVQFEDEIHRYICADFHSRIFELHAEIAYYVHMQCFHMCVVVQCIAN
jgi:hypothetical protein